MKTQKCYNSAFIRTTLHFSLRKKITKAKHDADTTIIFTVESRFLEPPGENQIGSRNRRWHQITLNWPSMLEILTKKYILSNVDPDRYSKTKRT